MAYLYIVHVLDYGSYTVYNCQDMARADRVEASNRVHLTPETIVGKALSLAESDGLEAVTIRRLSQNLGVTPMAIYWHFRNKDKLLDAMADHILAEMDLTADTASPWQAQLKSLMESLLIVLQAHSAAAILVSTRSALSESSLKATEAMLDVLRQAGFSPPEATQIVRHALDTITNLVVGESRLVPQRDAPAWPGRARASAIAGDPQGDSEEMSEEMIDAQRGTRAFLEALPPKRYPRIIEAAAPLSARDDPSAYYAFGLDLLLAGIEAMAARKL